MRSVFIVTLLLLFIQLHAQNWAPVNRNEKFNFELNSAGFITNTLWVDSASVSGSDSVFYLNRIVTDCDTCPATYKLCNQPDFLKKNMYKRSGGTYEFRLPGSVVIKTLATEGQSWLYDTANSITATVYSISLSPVFGIADSVKEIHLSDGGVLKLSKDHGLLQFSGANSDSVFTLGGIEGRNLGEIVPKFSQIYNYQVGDILQYHEKDIYYSPYTNGHEHLTKITILSKDSAQGYYSYGIKKIICSWIVEINGFTHDTTHYYELTTLSFQDSVLDLSNYYPLQIVENAVDPGISGPNASYIQTALDNQGVYSKWIGSFNFYDDGLYIHGTETTPPLPYDVLLPIYSFYYVNNFKNGLGNTMTAFMVFEAYYLNELIGYIRNGDTVGTVYPDDYLLAGVRGDEESGNIGIYPNPCSDHLSLRGVTEGVIYNIVITDLTGNTLIHCQSDSFIDVSTLNPGLYILNATDPITRKSRKLKFVREP